MVGVFVFTDASCTLTDEKTERERGVRDKERGGEKERERERERGGGGRRATVHVYAEKEVL